MEGQQFCLRWHNFQNTLLSSLPKLLDGGHLTDVTLSAGGRHIHAHKIILSACSYYFKELFKDLSSLQHPVIILPGMEYGNLCALVTFMYSGEVNIYQEQLPALLAMANTLHIRGLADIGGDRVVLFRSLKHSMSFLKKYLTVELSAAYNIHTCIKGTIMNTNDIHEIKIVVCVATKCKWMHPMEPYPIE